MENKTDKPYSHKQAKNDIAKKYGYESWFDINFYQVDSNNVTTKAPYSEEVLRDEAAELYASKATEELRKENEAAKELINMLADAASDRTAEIERLKESNKELQQTCELLRIASAEESIELTKLWPEVCRRAQLECARETLKEASKKALFSSPDYVAKVSILDEANIKLIQ